MQDAASIRQSWATQVFRRAADSWHGLFSGPAVDALTASLAAELRREHQLAVWVASLRDLATRERSVALRRAADRYRANWNTFGLADALTRIAVKPARFRAVVRELAASMAEEEAVLSAA